MSRRTMIEAFTWLRRMSGSQRVCLLGLFVRAACVSAAAAATAEATDGDQPNEESLFAPPEPIGEEKLRALFGRIDGDADGKVATAELMAFTTKMRRALAERHTRKFWKAFDRDGDSKVSLEEALELGTNDLREPDDHQRKVDAGKFKAADKDADGLLDEREVVTFVYPEVDTAVEEVVSAIEIERKDANKDGELSIQEFFETDESSLGAYIKESERSDFEKLDKDGNGKLNAQEMKIWESGRFRIEESMLSLIDHSDVNKDDYVTFDELLTSWKEKLMRHDASYHFEEWAHQLEL